MYCSICETDEKLGEAAALDSLQHKHTRQIRCGTNAIVKLIGALERFFQLNHIKSWGPISSVVFTVHDMPGD